MVQLFSERSAQIFDQHLIQDLLHKAQFHANRTHVQRNIKSVTQCIKELDSVKLLNSTNIDKILSYRNLSDLASALNALRYVDVLTQTNFDVMVEHMNPKDIALGFYNLVQARLYTPHNCLKVVDYPYNHGQLIQALRSLRRLDELNQDVFDLLIITHQPMSLAMIFSGLAYADMLTPKNGKAVVAMNDLVKFSAVLGHLIKFGMFNQKIFDDICAPKYAALLSETIWRRLPAEILTSHWPQILEAASNKYPTEALNQLCYQLAGIKKRITQTTFFRFDEDEDEDEDEDNELGDYEQPLMCV